jgi:hypothetical protein
MLSSEIRVRDKLVGYVSAHNTQETKISPKNDGLLFKYDAEYKQIDGKESCNFEIWHKKEDGIENLMFKIWMNIIKGIDCKSQH